MFFKGLGRDKLEHNKLHVSARMCPNMNPDFPFKGGCGSGRSAFPSCMSSYPQAFSLLGGTGSDRFCIQRGKTEASRAQSLTLRRPPFLCITKEVGLQRMHEPATLFYQQLMRHQMTQGATLLPNIRCDASRPHPCTTQRATQRYAYTLIF